MTLDIDQQVAFWAGAAALYLAFATVMGRWAYACNIDNSSSEAPAGLVGFAGFVLAPLTLVCWVVSVGMPAGKPGGKKDEK